uniref:NADH dehydrogenase subunit 2 n=1 Tax=Ixodes ovatus TaxID=59652 RepID=UPI001FAE96B5|nr:NADH dehydrogenase subunit 2 [Ixodes ovatus]UNO53689.1 NADH dehydrogenase subunit 2 [Ixodes ovatus]
MILQKMIFFWILLVSLLMALSSSFWFSLWMALEMNMMIFIPMMNSKNFLSSNSMLYYYIVQSMSSSLFFMSSLMSIIFSNNVFIYIIIISMMIKLGSAPFHSWYPQISEGMNYSPFFVLSTLQKIIPLHIISIFQNNLIILFIIMSSMVGSLGGLSQMSMKKILAFSSISHMAWIFSLIMINQNFWLIYLIFYSLILMKITNILNKNNSLSILNLNSMKSSLSNKVYLFSFILSLGGLPPFLGFFMKWVAVMLISKNFILILLVLIASSLTNLYFYMRCMFPLILNMNIMMKSPNLFYINTSTYFLMINFLGVILICPWMMMF